MNGLELMNLPRKETLNKAIMNTVWFRHGETFHNEGKRLQGSIDDEEARLTKAAIEKTRQQAIDLSTRFHPDDPITIITSTLYRAQQTAEIIAQQIPKATVVISPLFNEYSFGDWEGVPTDDLRANAQHEGIFIPTPFTASIIGIPPKGENMVGFAARIKQAIETLTAVPDEKRVVVTHATVLRMIRYLNAISRIDSIPLTTELLLSHEREFFNDSQEKFRKVPNGLISNEFFMQ